MRKLIAGLLFAAAGSCFAQAAPPQYSACILSLAPATSATDVFTLAGSATKVVTVTSLDFSGTQTTLGPVSVQVVKRSSANTGGTSTTPTAVSRDSAQGAATAVARAYSANPSGLGTLVGALSVSREIVVGATGTASTKRELLRTPQVLRGTAEVLALNLNATTVTGGNLALCWSWSEE